MRGCAEPLQKTAVHYFLTITIVNVSLTGRIPHLRRANSMAAIMSEFKQVHSMATANQPPVIWLGAVILTLTLIGAADILRTTWRGGGVDLHGVRSRLVWEGGRKVLLIEGELANPRRASVSLAPIRFSVRDREGADLHTWTIAAPRASLAAGDRTAFVTRLPAPPERGFETVVRLEPLVGSAAPAPRLMAASTRSGPFASSAPLRAAALDDLASDPPNLPNLRKMP
jgi:hypothetical protein